MPTAIACTSWVPEPTTTLSASRCPGTSAAARSISSRTGVCPRVPMISRLVISAPSQCDRSITSAAATPGTRYLLPPEKPTTSCGKTGPTTSTTSCSATARLRRTGTGAAQPPAGDLRHLVRADGADRGQRRRVPPLVVAYLTPGRPTTGPRCAASASSDIGAWVPRATSMVSRLTRPASAAWTASSSSGIGALRVASGTVRTRCARPARPRRACPVRTRVPPPGQHLGRPAQYRRILHGDHPASRRRPDQRHRRRPGRIRPAGADPRATGRRQPSGTAMDAAARGAYRGAMLDWLNHHRRHPARRTGQLGRAARLRHRRCSASGWWSASTSRTGRSASSTCCC